MFHVSEERKGFQYAAYAAGILGFWDGKNGRLEILHWYTYVKRLTVSAQST